MIDDIVPLIPVHFFNVKLPCYGVKRRKLEKRHLLPKLTELTKEKPIANLFLGWHKEGIACKVESSRELETIELFFDTRDRKTMGYPTRFCHHFIFDQEEGQEVTRFRTDDAHDLCNPELLEFKSNQIWIPKIALHGYEPAQFNRLGFTYRLNGGEQTFTISDVDFSIEKHPSFWSTLTLEAS